MQTILRRLASLVYLSKPLATTFVGIVLLSLGVAYLLVWFYGNVPVPGFVYYLTLQFMPELLRAAVLLVAGLGVLGAGIWNLSGVVSVSLRERDLTSNKMVIGYRAAGRPPRIVVLSGGAGVLILANLGRHVEQMTCITPVQDPIEYYYRASGLFQFQNVHYVVPTPETLRVYAELDEGTVVNVMRIDNTPELAPRYVKRLYLAEEEGHRAQRALAPIAQAGGNGAVMQAAAPITTAPPLTRPALEAIRNADAIVFGPGSLFESILPNFLIDELRVAVQQSKARKIYICNLMTEPGLTTGFSVGDHIREIKQYAGFAPDYTLVNVQRIESEVQQLYAAAHQMPVYLTPEEYEETVVPMGEGVTQRQLMLEDSVIIESDLASAVIQFNASVNNPGENWAVRVLRHDPEKLTTTILELLRRE